MWKGKSGNHRLLLQAHERCFQGCRRKSTGHQLRHQPGELSNHARALNITPSTRKWTPPENVFRGDLTRSWDRCEQPDYKAIDNRDNSLTKKDTITIT
ncbi:MAG: hypothetical protein ACLU4J_10745 [Butyricimonas paravirosa]